MEHMNKFIVAIAGAVVALVVGLSQQYAGVDLSTNVEVLKNFVIAGLTAFFVWFVPNKD